MGARETRKGKRGEREVVQVLRCHGIDAHRTAPLQAGASSSAGDVTVPGPFHLEVKRGRRVNVRAALRQAEAACPSGLSPIVVHRDDGGRWCVTAYLEDVLETTVEALKRSEVIR